VGETFIRSIHVSRRVEDGALLIHRPIPIRPHSLVPLGPAEVIFSVGIDFISYFCGWFVRKCFVQFFSKGELW
jgi:hypothetical protein